MLAWLKESTAGARAKIAAEASKFKNRTFMEAVVAGCALVAAADGEITSDEKQKMAGFIQRADELKHFEMTEVIAQFNKVAGDFEFDAGIGKSSALQTIGKLKGDGEKEMLVRVVCAIGAADGNFDDDEKAIVREICQKLDLSPADFDL